MTPLVIGIPLTVLAIAFSASGAVGGAADAGDRGCAVRNSRILAIDRLGRVYSVREPDVGRVWLGCIDARSHRKVFLGASNERIELSKARLNTPFVTFVEDTVHQFGSSRDVVLLNLRSRRDAAASTGNADVTDLIVTRRGAVVFIAAATDEHPARLRLLTRSEDRVLDEGSIAAGSLAVDRSGTRAYWLKDGMPMTSTLP